MLRVVTFDEKWQNWPTLVISYKVIRGAKTILNRYENFDFHKKKNDILQNSAPGQNVLKKSSWDWSALLAFGALYYQEMAAQTSTEGTASTQQ